MQRQRRTICLSVLALFVWVSTVIFIGEITLFTSPNKTPKQVTRSAKLPPVFRRLAEDKIWRERIIYSMLSKNSNKSTDMPNEKKQTKINKQVHAKALPVQNAEPIRTILSKDSSVKRNRSKTLTRSDTELSITKIAAIDRINISAHAETTAKTVVEKARNTNTHKVFKDELNSSDSLASIIDDGTGKGNHIHSIASTKSPNIGVFKVNTHPRKQNQTSTEFNTGIQKTIVLNGASMKTRTGAYSVIKPYNISNSLISSNDSVTRRKGDVVKLHYRLDNKKNRSYAAENLTAKHSANMFSKDYIPKIYRNNTTFKETIHFCVIAAKAEISKEVEILVKSIILHARRADVMFHFVTDDGPDAYIANTFEHINLSFVNVSYEIIKTDLKTYLHRKLNHNVQITHPQSGIYGIGKIFMYDLLPYVDRCIVVDTDVLFATDPAFLWHELRSRLQPPVAVAVTMQKGDQYFNSGLMLHDLALMRKIKFGSLLSMENCEMVKNKTSEIYRCYHDQLLLNAVMKHYPELFDIFTVSWNLGLCFNFKNFTFKSFEEETSGLFFGAAHLSCLKHINAIQGIKHVPNWKHLTEYVHYLEETEV